MLNRAGGIGGLSGRGIVRRLDVAHVRQTHQRRLAGASHANRTGQLADALETSAQPNAWLMWIVFTV